MSAETFDAALMRAHRIGLVGAFIASFDSDDERIDIIRRLRSGDLITDQTADILTETYIREPAR